MSWFSYIFSLLSEFYSLFSNIVMLISSARLNSSSDFWFDGSYHLLFRFIDSATMLRHCSDFCWFFSSCCFSIMLLTKLLLYPRSRFVCWGEDVRYLLLKSLSNLTAPEMYSIFSSFFLAGGNFALNQIGVSSTGRYFFGVCVLFFTIYYQVLLAILEN